MLSIMIGLILFVTPVIYGETLDNNSVYVIPIKDEITPAMSVFLRDEINKANSKGAQGIIIEITTLGGRVDSALEMKSAIANSAIPVVVYIQERAISAGALISIASDTIIMAPGSQIGAAEPRPYDEKTVAVIRGEFGSTAENTGRDPIIAEAMVDKGIEIPGLIKEGEILSLKATTAEEYGYAEAILSDREAVLEYMGWSDGNVVEATFDYRMRIAQHLTKYEVASILLAVGMIAIIIEILTQGFGIAGIVGISSLLLYFGGNMIAGYTQWWALILFIIGLGLLIGEIAVPGFGVLGVGGIVTIIASLVFAAPDPMQGLASVGIAFLLCIIVVPILFKMMGKTSVFRRLVLAEAETVEKGYVNVADNNHMLGKTGKSVTPLRPSGTVIIDGNRIDVVTDGEYLPIDTKIRVVRVEGSRIVVAENFID